MRRKAGAPSTGGAVGEEPVGQLLDPKPPMRNYEDDTWDWAGTGRPDH